MSGDGATALLFNGEVYDAPEHRSALERDGCRFRTGTDTEVVLALYERDGVERMLEQLDGMFAMAIADTRRGAVHLVRDRLGIKPLYWSRQGSTVLFASEAKAFLAHPSFRAAIDPAQVDEVLAFRSIAGEASLLEGVRLVRPGHRLTITPESCTDTCYWSVPDYGEKTHLSRSEAIEGFGRLLGRSVGMQLRGDVTVGCQLSGGVDSSLVTVLARAHHPDPDLHAFSIVFDHTPFSEEPWIVTAATAAGAISHRFVFDAAAFIGALDAASWHLDQPIGHPNSMALWLLAQRAREHATVLLSGEGADELFGGYARALDAHAPAGSGRPGATDPIDAFIRASQFHSETRLMRLRRGADLRPAIEKRRALFREGHADHLSNCLKYDMQTHLVDVLMRQDKMTMAHGVENRVPFLDRHVVDFARSLPEEHLVGPLLPGGAPCAKVVVKALAQRHFDAGFVHRRKRGFNLPLSQYFRSRPFEALMEDRLLPGMAARGLVDVAVVRRWWRRALSAPSTTEGFWITIALELWAQQFIDR
jgi:asparagine synthase (glutamine-hydrolysing)